MLSAVWPKGDVFLGDSMQKFDLHRNIMGFYFLGLSGRDLGCVAWDPCRKWSRQKGACILKDPYPDHAWDNANAQI